MSNPNDYTIGWICAISTEYVAARAFLDEKHEPLESVSSSNNNVYTLGKFGKHNVVITVLPNGEYGIAAAASVATDMLNSFPNIRFGLMVGIGGGAPSQKHDIRLGDIVVSAPRNGKGGVFQYDFGKTIQDQKFRTTGYLNQPPTLLRAAVTDLAAQYEEEGHQLEDTINTVLEKMKRLRKNYKRPDGSSDRLYQSGVIHPPEDESSCAVACGNDPSNLILRPERTEDEDNPTIHYGLIASANQLMKDATVRDRLAAEKDVLCFEMEAAGLMNHFPCLVIRGICDYSDSHKNKEWQGYAAMAAAAYAKDLLCRIPPNKIEAEKRILLSIDHTVSEIESNVKTIIADAAVKQSQEIFDWMSPLNFSTQQDKVFIEHREGTGEWMLKTKEFRNWLDGAERTLWCPGIPGAGKTVLTSIIVNYLKNSFDQKETGIAYVYCNYKDRERQTAVNLLTSILQQLVQRNTGTYEKIVSLYKHHMEKRTRPLLDEWSGLLRSEVCRFSKVFLVIDALDECSKENSTREVFLKEIQKLDPSIHLLVTSRHSSDIELEFEKASRLEIHANDADVRNFLDHYFANNYLLASNTKRDANLKEKVTNALIKNAKGMFLLAQLHIRALSQEDNPADVYKALKELPEGLKGTYDDAMQRIGSQGKKQVKRAEQVLSWLAYSLRPLTMIELQHALAVSPGHVNFVEDSIPDEAVLVSICAGLVTVDKNDKIIRLIHHTTQEYLESIRTVRFPKAQTIIAATCLVYLSFDVFEKGYCRSDQEMLGRMQEYRFLKYAAQNWGYHAREDREEDVKELALKFLRNDSKLACSTQAMYLAEHRYPKYSQDFPKRMTGLHIAALFGLAKIVQTLLSGGGVDINSRNSDGRTPLSMAAGKGNEEVTSILLERGADVMPKDSRGWTALHWACKEGHDGVVQLLLENGANMAMKDKQGATVLYWAAEKGHEAIVRLLLEKGADVATNEKRGMTALHGAAGGGHKRVVQLLLEKGADIAAKDNDFGRRPLHRAGGSGHEEVVRVLLENGADIDATNNSGRTVLHRAAGAGREAVTRVLLEKGANVNLKDTTQGVTPLHQAAEGGHEVIVRMLLNKGADVSVKNDEKGATALHWAAWGGHQAIVRLLLEKGADASVKDDFGTTVLHEAARSGSTTVILQLSKEKIDINAKNLSGETPLHYAAAGGHEMATRLLLEIGADITAKDVHGRTALHRAAEAKDVSGATALHRAAMVGNLALVRLLLAGGADIAAKNSMGATALHWAAAWAQEPVVRLLIEMGADVSAKDKYGWTPIHRASNDRHGGSSRHEAVTWLLVEKRANAVTKDARETKAVDLEIDSDPEAATWLLVEKGANAATKDACETKAVDLEIGGGPEAAVRRVLVEEAAHMSDAEKMTLYREADSLKAATTGHEGVLRLLLENGADINAMDKSGKTSLQRAVENGHEAIVQLLSKYKNDLDAKM